MDISIVVIDDDVSSLELLSTALAQDGVRAFTAQDVEEGIEIVFREHPKIVLADFVTPGVSGLDILDRVVAFDAAIDVIVITAHQSSESAVEAIPKGAAGYLTKPVSISLLRQRVSNCIDTRMAYDYGTWPAGIDAPCVFSRSKAAMPGC